MSKWKLLILVIGGMSIGIISLSIVDALLPTELYYTNYWLYNMIASLGGIPIAMLAGAFFGFFTMKKLQGKLKKRR